MHSEEALTRRGLEKQGGANNDRKGRTKACDQACVRASAPSGAGSSLSPLRPLSLIPIPS